MAEDQNNGGQAGTTPATPAIAPGGETAGDPSKAAAGGGAEDDKKPTDDPTKGDPQMIPSYRLKDEADKRREAEAKLAEYQEKERKETEKKQLEQGKHKEVIATKDQEIVDLKSQTEKIPKYDEAIIANVTSELALIEKSISKEKLDKILGVLKFSEKDALSKLEALTQVKELVSEITPVAGAKGGQGITADKKSDPSDPSKPQSFNQVVKNMLGLGE